MREGSTIGAYRILRKLGHGGMGEVFLGEHELIGRQAAIKVLLPEMSEPAHVDRFFNEARASTTVSDPGIVQVYDFGYTPDGVAYIVMEHLVGEQVDHRLARLGVWPMTDALRLTRQVAGSLAAAHAAGIVHRDLKPDNLFVIHDADAAGGERPKILDFGVAKLANHAADRVKTRTGAVIGTPLYMSPEQCDGRSDVDHRADIYSLGCVLFHLVTGKPPFDVVGAGAVMLAHLSEPAPAPSSIMPGLPRALDELVLRCLAKQPAERFADMLELQRACDALIARAVEAPTITLPPDPGARRTRRGVWLGFGALAAVGAIAFAIAMAAGARIAAPAAPAAHLATPLPASPPASRPQPVQPPPTPSATTALPIAPPPAPVAPAAAASPAKHPPRAPHAKTKPEPDPEVDDLYGDR